jgi:UDP-N-acetylglucosamine:LPS N-acetylglucosamine transferase
VILYDLATDQLKSRFDKHVSASFICRPFNQVKVDKIKNSYQQEKVFVSVGRSIDYDFEIDVSHLNYQFIVTQGINLIGENVIYLPVDTTNTQDYLAACDYVITKAGFSTISECILSGSKMAVIGRDFAHEDRVTLNYLLEKELGIKINLDKDGFDIESILKKLSTFNPRYDKHKFTNDYQKISKYIIDSE